MSCPPGTRRSWFEDVTLNTATEETTLGSAAGSWVNMQPRSIEDVRETMQMLLNQEPPQPRSFVVSPEVYRMLQERYGVS